MLESIIRYKEAELKQKIKEMKGFLRIAPAGLFKRYTKRGHTYYAVLRRTKDGKYKEKRIDPEDHNSLILYATKAFCRKALPLAEAQLKILAKFQGSKFVRLEGRLHKLSEEYREWADPVFLDWESRARRWKSEPYEKNEMPFSEIHQNVDGIDMRSKIECIVSHCIKEICPYYRYEEMITLKNGHRKSPDFTVMSHYNGRIVYIEVFGAMTDMDYAMDTLAKIKEYGENGILIGINFLPVFDTRVAPFDPIAFQKELDHLLHLP